jgi:cyclic beta-1,2-glucan synthetase
MYRAGLEAVLGFRLLGNAFSLNPCIPREWPGFRITYRHGAARYIIEVENPEGVSCGVAHITLDGAEVASGRVPLTQDGAEHRVQVILGRDPEAQPEGVGRMPTMNEVRG